MKRLPLAAFLLALYTMSFIVIVRLGLFAESRPPLRGILMSSYVLVAVLALLILLIASAVVYRSRMDRPLWLVLISAGVIVAGLWTSRFADFKIDVVLTEGQVYETDAHRSVGLLYMGLFSSVPKFRMLMENVVLEADAGGAADGSRVLGRLQLQAPDGKPPRGVSLSQGVPRYRQGMFLSLKRYGYSLRYVLKKSGKVLDSDFISLRIYPTGSEDYFRLLSPHTFYVRYYPGRMEGGAERPLKLKIARNKDIISSGYVALNQDVSFEDAKISFDEMRRWIEVSITRNWGELMAWAGLALGCMGALLLLIPKSRSSSPL